jgi:hypothetical protein
MPVKWNNNLYACLRHVQVTGAMWIYLQATLACHLRPCIPMFSRHMTVS